MNKKRFMGIILVTALILTPAMYGFGADIDESKELDKYYMTGDVGVEDPITVVISKDSADAKAENRIAAKYAFESDLSKENVEELFEKNSQKIADIYNNVTKRTVTIEEGSYQFLVDFIDEYLDVYMTKTMPDMDTYYDLSSNARKENKLSVEAYIYKNAVIKSNKVESVDNTLDIKAVTPITDNVDEIVFYVQRTFHIDYGDESGGTRFVAHVAATNGERKLLKLWIQDFAYEMMQNKIKSNYLSREFESAKVALARDIVDEFEAKKVRRADDKQKNSLNSVFEYHNAFEWYMKTCNKKGF